MKLILPHHRWSESASPIAHPSLVGMAPNAMKTRAILLLLIFVSTLPAAEDKVVVPGLRVGTVSLMEKLSSVKSELGSLSFEDAAMGRLWATWVVDPPDGRIAVFCLRPDEHTFVVQRILVTSPKYATASGISVGSTFSQINKLFPEMTEGATYQSSFQKRRITVYHCSARGIAFEFPAEPKPSEQCIGFIIHPMGMTITGNAF